MAGENKRLLDRMADAINSGVIPEDLLTPDYVVENLATAVTDKTYNGAEGALEWRNDLYDVFKDAKFEYRIDKEGEDFAICRFRISGEGAASGVPLDLRWMGVAWFRNGQVARTAGFENREEAFRAVGLPVEPRPATA